MPRFSLIVPTLGRTAELAALLISIGEQERDDVEVVIVDQNDDDRVFLVIEALPFQLNLHHLRISLKNVSAARNTGMDAATGEIFAFPDDDCWYPSGLLDGMDAWFRSHTNYAVRATGALDDDGLVSGNRWFQSECDITSWNALRTTFCSSLFIFAAERCRQVRFNPKLSHGEETDFILRLLATGLRGRFDRALHVHHARRDMLSGTVSKERARRYGAGMGSLTRRHSLIMLWAGLLAYDVARALFVSVRGKFDDAGFCFAHAEGLFRGFILWKATYE